jgi:hypothetical protein
MKARTVSFAMFALLAVITAGLWLRYSRPLRQATSPLAEVTALPPGAGTMTLAELDSTLGDHFETITNLAEIPQAVEESFCRVEHCNFKGVRFDMVNPGEAMSTDFMIPGVPNKRLKFAATNDHSAVVFYEWGGYADQHCVVVLDFRRRTSWGACLTTYRVKTFDQLRSAISGRQFVQWRRGDRE